MVYLPCDHVLLYVVYWVDDVLWSTPYAVCRHVIFVHMFQGRPHFVVYPTPDMSPRNVVRMFLGRPQNVVYPPCVVYLTHDMMPRNVVCTFLGRPQNMDYPPRIMLPPIVLHTGVGRP